MLASFSFSSLELSLEENGPKTFASHINFLLLWTLDFLIVNYSIKSTVLTQKIKCFAFILFWPYSLIFVWKLIQVPSLTLLVIGSLQFVLFF